MEKERFETFSRKGHKDVKRFPSYAHHLYSRRWRALVALMAAIGLIAGMFGLTGAGTSARAAGSLPCDIYAAGGTPCVAAHSTIRALFASYNGPLYQVRRASDNTTRDIGLLSPGGYANSAAQDSFCAGTTCSITIIYDQSGHGNNLAYQGPGGAGGHSTPSSATSESLTVAGNKVYSLYINSGNSYWHDGSKSGMPLGSSPQGAYMVTSGTHVNGGCCFDYGNSETDRSADGAGAMDAINFSTSCWFGGCSGSGPWVQADLEYGLYPGGSSSWNPNQRAFPNRFVTAMLKNNGTTQMALKGGNAQSGSLATLYKGSLPPGYSPMRQQGAIDLGAGGDCCVNGSGINLSVGTFYEGAIVAGYPSDATDDAVQANIVASGYGSSSAPTPTPMPTPGLTPTPIPTSTPGSTPTPTPTTGPGGTSCKVTYTVTNQWQGGFGANIAITNTSSTAWSGWTLKFSFANGQTITQLWNGTVAQSGNAVTVTNASYNGSVAPGASVNPSPGFNGTWNGSNPNPTSFSVNGESCTTA
jgi:hypothetical protein